MDSDTLFTGERWWIVYKVGETILVKGKITRKTEEMGQKPLYRVNMCCGSTLDLPEEEVAGTMMNIVKLEEGKEE